MENWLEKCKEAKSFRKTPTMLCHAIFKRDSEYFLENIAVPRKGFSSSGIPLYEFDNIAENITKGYLEIGVKFIGWLFQDQKKMGFLTNLSSNYTYTYTIKPLDENSFQPEYVFRIVLDQKYIDEEKYTGIPLKISAEIMQDMFTYCEKVYPYFSQLKTEEKIDFIISEVMNTIDLDVK